MNATFFNKYAFHLLYPVVYIGFLVLDKEWFSRNNDWLTFLPTFVTQLALMFALIYFNTLVLIPKLLLRGKIVYYTVAIIATILAYTLLRSYYTQFIFFWLFNQEHPEPLSQFLWLSFVYGVWFTVISSMLYITQTWYEQKEKVKAAEVSQLEHELKYLRAQINPHFLFNGLNTIYGSISQENQPARDILLRFSDLLRYTIYEADADFVPLEKEVKYLENYVELLKARSNDNLRIDLTINTENNIISVAPMLFMPMVENAFKFVTREETSDNYITISLLQLEGTIEFTCSNSTDNRRHSDGGIGLANVRRRLELLYKDRYTLDIQERESNYTITLKLKL